MMGIGIGNGKGGLNVIDPLPVMLTFPTETHEPAATDGEPETTAGTAC